MLCSFAILRTSGEERWRMASPADSGTRSGFRDSETRSGSRRGAAAEFADVIATSAGGAGLVWATPVAGAGAGCDGGIAAGRRGVAGAGCSDAASAGCEDVTGADCEDATGAGCEDVTGTGREGGTGAAEPAAPITATT